jgi:hypothetical protein
MPVETREFFTRATTNFESGGRTSRDTLGLASGA